MQDIASRTSAHLQIEPGNLYRHLKFMLDEGLIDVPTLRDGERAWLCWKLSDRELGHWHTTREGFASRRPL